MRKSYTLLRGFWGAGHSFKYNPAGRRIYKSSSAGTSVFVYDGINLVEETNGAGVVVARYSQTENVDEPLAMLRSGATNYYEADGLGSITSLSNSAGALVQTYTFDSFGKRTGSTGSLTNPFQYTAREFDTETNLYFYIARYYDESVGRFLSEDPVTFKGGINFFSYGKNDPLNYADPSGLLSVCCRQVKSTLYILCHCFIVLNDNATSMGGYKDGLTLHPEISWPDDHPTPKTSSCDVVPGAGSACADSKVRDAFNSVKNDMPKGGFNYFSDGTSNTVAAEILRRAGIKYDFPWCAWGAGMPLGGHSPYTGGGGHK